VILVDVGALLLPALLRNYEVYVANGFEELLSLLVGEVAFLVFAVLVELVRG
jgi:hypothetical protein